MPQAQRLAAMAPAKRLAAMAIFKRLAVMVPAKRLGAIALAVLAALALPALVLGPAGPAAAQGLARKGAVTPESAFNPKPDPLDLALPMPCGLAMVFRVVGVNLDAKIKDLNIHLGSDQAEGDGYFDHRHRVFLGSTLSIDQLPAEWRPTAEAALMGGWGEQLFLMGKYEVTVAQWDSVMSGACAPVTAESVRPKSEVSWYDALDFTAKYMEWLIANSPASLPAFESEGLPLGIVRLPTEDEWEYAAMGGHVTGKQHIEANELFELAVDQKLADYGLFRDPGRNPESQPGAVGRWLPNPLGLYDTVGNVAEMTMSVFKMTVGDRLHGAAGGLVRKGGGFISDASGVTPGRRVETPLFYADGPVSAKDLGLRVALSAASATAPGRLGALMAELAPLSPPPQVLSEPAEPETPAEPAGPALQPVNVEGLDPFQKIDALIAATSDPELRESYSAIRGDLGDFRLSEAWQSEAAVRNNCRALVYVVYTSRNTYSRYQTILSNHGGLEGVINDLKGTLGRRDISEADKRLLRKEIQSYEQSLARVAGELAQYEEVLRSQFTYYGKLLSSLRAYDERDRQAVNTSMIHVRQDIKGEDLFSEAMRGAFDRVNQDISSLRNGRLDKISLKGLIGAG